MAVSDFEPGTIGWTKALVAALTGSPVEVLSMPGGSGRQSVRAHLVDGRTVIATRRESTARGESEAGLLQALSAAGAPVPEVLGYQDGLMVQQDLGRRRLSHAMVHAPQDARLDLARAAMDALQACRATMTTLPELVAKVPGLGTRQGWAEDYVSQPFFLSGDLGVATPRVDTDLLAASLAHDPQHFTRWDARLANGAVQDDGRVFWFDWDLFGRRAGVEDLGGMVADDYWQIPLEQTLALLQEMVPDDALRQLALRIGVLVAANRLKRIAARVAQDGWADAEEVLRLDRMTAVPSVVADLTMRASQLAQCDPLTEGFVPWFSDVGEALLARPRD